MSFALWAGFLFLFFICFFLPFAVLLFLKKKTGAPLLASVFFGAAGFVVTQLFIRIPLLSNSRISFRLGLLPTLLYAFLLAFSAALFETTGRFCVLQWPLRRRSSYVQGLAAGIGHGWVEAAVLVGAGNVVNFLALLGYDRGGSALVAKWLGISPVAAQQMVAALKAVPVSQIFMAGAERLFTLCFHAAMMLLLLYWIKRGHPAVGFVLVVALHTATDFFTVLAAKNLLVAEGGLALIAAASVALCFFLRKRAVFLEAEL